MSQWMPQPAQYSSAPQDIESRQALWFQAAHNTEKQNLVGSKTIKSKSALIISLHSTEESSIKHKTYVGMAITTPVELSRCFIKVPWTLTLMLLLLSLRTERFLLTLKSPEQLWDSNAFILFSRSGVSYTEHQCFAKCTDCNYFVEQSFYKNILYQYKWRKKCEKVRQTLQYYHLHPTLLILTLPITQGHFSGQPYSTTDTAQLSSLKSLVP